ncbi:hypothetical protein A1507_10455 [Methylomonas koyamae]|uniref:HNH domain-containing protein n=1 Tax=Methylomonas koyamae TaxID=702114 RepID=A0A177NKW5_9GAMM|nr:hypothetical protein A1507_10455 [Methylomonas koyamae]
MIKSRILVNMECKLCKLPKDLQKSHIIPKFIYKPLRVDTKSMQRLSKNYSDEKKYKKCKPIQDGLKERLLCFDCEQLLNNKYEKYFKTAWFDEKNTLKLSTMKVLELQGSIIQNLSYFICLCYLEQVFLHCLNLKR